MAPRVLVALLAVIVVAGCGSEERGELPATPQLDRQLIEAAGRGAAGDVRALLRRGASVEARNDRGRTALTAAAYANDLDVARLLVRAGADANAKDAAEQSPYLVATSQVGDDPALLELMLTGGAEVDDKDRFFGTGLIRAAERGHGRIVRRLLRAGIAVDHVNRLGWTALLEAIVLGDGRKRHVETVRALVAGGADVNLPDGDGVTPLAHAQQRAYVAIARILRAAGARRSAA